MADNGPGIPDGSMEAIFKNTKIFGTPANKPLVLRFNLMISRQIIYYFVGKIAFENFYSSVDFKFTLPFTSFDFQHSQHNN